MVDTTQIRSGQIVYVHEEAETEKHLDCRFERSITWMAKTLSS